MALTEIACQKSLTKRDVPCIVLIIQQPVKAAMSFEIGY